MRQVKCDNCGANVIFDEDPYKNPIATRYWKSTFTKPKESMFVVQRKSQNVGKRGQITIQTLNEHILKIYCGVECGLEDYKLTEKVA